VSYIKVTAEELHSVSGQLNTAAQNINDANTSAMGQVNGLVGAGWEGAASTQFEQLFASWKAGATQVQEALAGISQLLNNAATTYTQTEEQIRQSMSQG
jgi:WXG100 family type VII secretion target